ncbi:MAG TPA: hypothetical protein PLV08_13775 [Flavobacteriales bacterium]|jgi:hypothetical protein|nr:hypothetical protein [Flavobacteriales bacterium]HQY00842.1 hypothetical protein [Flavobacteriales bacterium]
MWTWNACIYTRTVQLEELRALWPGTGLGMVNEQDSLKGDHMFM